MRFHQHQGITLLEVLISMAVFVVITAIILFGFVDSKKVQDLRAASGQLVADLRQIQTLAFSNQPFQVCSNTGLGTSFGSPCSSAVPCPGGTAESCGLVPAGGYGLTLSVCTTSPCQYQLYGDTGNGVLTGGVPEKFDGQLSTGPGFSDPILRTVTLPPKISVVSIKVSEATGVVTPANMFSVNVIPPKPITSFTADGVTAGVRVSFCLEHEQSHLRRLVTMVAASGQVTDKVVPNCS